MCFLWKNKKVLYFYQHYPAVSMDISDRNIRPFIFPSFSVKNTLPLSIEICHFFLKEIVKDKYIIFASETEQTKV
jgi:hypothetical protein